MEHREALLERIRDRRARVGVVGLGYVGLPLAVEFAKAGFRVWGIEVDPERVRRLRAGESYVQDVESWQIKGLVAEGRLEATSEFDVLREADAAIICVPTPLRKTRDPDLSYVVAAVEEVAARLHPGQLVVLESTTYPGSTEELVLPRLERGGLRVGEDFFLAFSPERVDPGNPRWKTPDIPKVIGGVTEACTLVAGELYRTCIRRVIPVSSPRVAEMVKLLENTFRSVNIALANEMALMCHRMGINVWEVIEAAASKPFGFMPFWPGPGLGGHCIPIDPFYLSWRARQEGFEPRFIELAGQINAYMPRFVVERIGDALNERGKPLKGSRVHLLGVAYKPNVSDTRESPALDVIRLLWQKHALVVYSDPHVPALQLDGQELRSQPLELVAEADCCAIITHHDAFDYELVLERAPLIFDARGALRGVRSDKVVLL